MSRLVRIRLRGVSPLLPGIALAMALAMVLGACVGSASFSLTTLAAGGGSFEPGEAVPITVRVANDGNAAGIYPAALTINGAVVDQRDVELEPGTSTSIRFTVIAGAPGEYEVEVGGQLTRFRVAESPAAFSVRELAIETGAEEIRAGLPVELSARVENTGGTAGTYEAELLIDGLTEARQEVDVGARSDATVRFSVMAGEPGVYILTLGTAETTLLVPAPAAFVASDLRVIPDDLDKSETATAAVVIANTGDLPGSHVVELLIDGKVGQSSEATLAGGEETTIEFTLAALAPGRHVLAVDALEADLIVRVIGRPPNGKVLVNKVGGGMGQLTIQNGNDRDAFVVLARTSAPGTPVLAVYVRAGEDATIRKLKDGTYTLYFSLGARWDTVTRTFTVDPAFRRVDDTLAFRTTRSGNVISYTIINLTLHSVSGGTVPIDSIDEGEFPVVP